MTMRWPAFNFNFSFLILIAIHILTSCGRPNGNYFSSFNSASSVPSGPSLQTSNLISNPGFENGLDSWQNWGNSATSNTQAFAGTLALQVGTGAGGIGQDIISKVVAGASYQLSGYAKITNPAEYAHIGVNFKNAAGVDVLSKTVQITSQTYSIYNMDFTVPAGAVTGQVGIWKNAGSSILFVDDLSLVLADAVVAPIPTPMPAPAPMPTPVPTPAPVGGVGYPFGSHKVAYVAGIRPNSTTQVAQDAVVAGLYDRWKGGLRTNCGGDYYVYMNASRATVSEGAGYGMVIVAIMAGYDANAKTIFDGLFKFARRYPAYNQSPNLMEWAVNADCSKGGDGWSALDGDLDIAMGLLLADKQWGSTGAINYFAEAVKTINAIKAVGVKSDGSYIIQRGGSRTSDYMTSHFKAFKKATGDSIWDLAVDKAYLNMDLIQKSHAPVTGLIPDWIVGLPGTPRPANPFEVDGNNNEGDYFWNACRIPWRLATDYVMSGDVRAKNITSKMTAFFQRSSGGDPTKVYPAYKLDGTALDTRYNSASFSGPAAAGAMVDGSYQTFLNSMYTWNVDHPTTGYYDNELQLIPMIVMTGNWWLP